MSPAVLGTFYMISMPTVMLLISIIAIIQSWKDGSFVPIMLFAGLFFFALSALVFQFKGDVTLSMYVLALGVVVILFALFIVAPMAQRRARRRG